MLIAPRDASRGQHIVGSSPQLAITAGYPPVIYAARIGNRLPTRAFTQWTNLNWRLNHCNTSFQNDGYPNSIPGGLAFAARDSPRGCRYVACCPREFSLLNVHSKVLFAQAGIPDHLCTSCAGPPRSVEDVGKSFLPFPEGAPQARTGAKEVRNGLPARIFTVDIPPRESTIPAVRFPNPV